MALADEKAETRLVTEERSAWTISAPRAARPLLTVSTQACPENVSGGGVGGGEMLT